MLKTSEKLNINSETKADEVLAILDWENFDYKDWRFVKNIALAYMQDGEEKNKLVSEFNKHVDVESAVNEVITMVDVDKYERFVKPIVERLRAKGESDENIRDCLYGGLTSHVLEYCGEDASMWESLFTRYESVEESN